MVGRVAVSLAVVATGVLATMAPAGAATPLVSASAIVNQPPVDSLLSLCVTSRTLDPSGTCLTLGSTLPAAPATSSGTATMSTVLGFGGGVVFGFDGHFTIGAQTFTGSVSGVANAECFSSCSTPLPPFALSGTSASGSFDATCTGELITADVDQAFPYIVGGATSELSCNGSANGGPPGNVTLLSVYRTDGYGVAFKSIDYSGLFAGA